MTALILQESFLSSYQPRVPVRYCLTAPDDLKEGETLPLILFLHGAGERGNDLNMLHGTGLSKLFLDNQTYGGNRCFVLMPQCPDGMVWNTQVYALKDLIDSLVIRFPIDVERIAVTGLSMGGFGTWEMAITFPGFFSCAAPCCGGGMSWRCGVLRSLPIRAFHSRGDGSVPLFCSVDMVSVTNACGGHAELTIYESNDHNCWDRAYTTTDVIPWMLAQRAAK